MNKLLRSITSRPYNMMTPSANQDSIRIAPDMIDVTVRVDAQTWRYFDSLDEDARSMMSRVLKDYVEKQK
jgi:hypothetical protein